MKLGLLFNLGNDNNKGEFVPPPPAAPVNVVAPVISGEPHPSYVLQCSVGTWSGWPSPSFSYQWKKDGVAISGASSSTYTVVSDDVDAVITCTVTATNTEGNASATSAGVTVVLLPVAPYVVVMPAISGTPNPGSVLSCTNGTWAGTPAPTLTRQWTRNGVPISGATNSTYTLQAQDDGAIVSCTITATNSSGSANAAAEGVLVFIPTTLPSNTAVPVISGTPILGSTLSCSTGSWTGYPTPTYAYQWKRDGASIAGATSSTYTVNASDNEGDALSCTVTATNVVGSASATSASVTVVVPTEAPVNVSTPVLSGTPNVGESLTVSTGTWTGTPAPSFTYQWKKDGVDISSATASSYTIVSGDMNGVLTCVVTATNSAGSSSAESNSKTVVEAATNPFDALYDPEFALVEGQTFYSKPSVTEPPKMTDLNTPGLIDSNFGTRIYHVTTTDDTPDTLTNLRHVYSRQTAFNCDGTKLLTRASNGWWHLYDALTGAHLDGGRTQSPGNTGLDGFVNECEAFWHPTDPNKVWLTGNQGLGMEWREFDITTKTSTTLFDLTSKIHGLGGDWANAGRAWFKGEGRPSNDGRWFGLIVQTSGFGLIGFIMYDRLNDEIVGHQLCSNMPDHCSTSPLGNYIVISWYGGTTENLDVAATRDINSCNGARAYSRDFSTWTQLSSLGEHSDCAVDAQGNEVFVSITYHGGTSGAEYDVTDGNIYYRRMDTGEAFDLPGNAYGGSSDSACHFSGLSTQKPGWVVVGWYGSNSPATWKDGAICIVELVPENQRVYRVCHHQSVYGSNYINEPHAAPSQDLSRIVFASNFGSANAEDYLVGIPSWAVGTAGADAPPSNTVAPVITGDAMPEGTLTCSTGSWSGVGNTYAYQWRKDSVDIGGATSSSFSIPGSGYPDGTAVDCQVTATNDAGSSSALSNTVTVSVASAPVNTVSPQAVGEGELGTTLSCDNGEWTGSPTPTFSYQWQLYDTSNWVDVSGATSSTFTPEAAGSYRCVVTATNTHGSASATSNTQTVEEVPEPEALSVVQSKGGGSTDGSNLSVTLDDPTTTGNTLVAALQWQATNNVPPEVTDSEGNTWTLQGTVAEEDYGGYTYYLAVYVASNITGGTTPVISAFKDYGYHSMIVVEIAGASTTDPVDVFAAVGDATSPYRSPSVTPTGNGRLFLTFASTYDHTSAVPESPFTVLKDLPVGSVAYWTMTSSYYVQETAASLSPGFTLTPSNPAVVGTLVLK